MRGQLQIVDHDDRRVLASLGSMGALSQVELAKQTGLSRSAVRCALLRLRARGQVTRKRYPDGWAWHQL